VYLDCDKAYDKVAGYMPLFFGIFIFFRYAKETAVRHIVTMTNFDYSGGADDVILMKGSSLLMFGLWEVLFESLKSVQILTISPRNSNPCPNRVQQLTTCLH
jgi:hypothetical protein